MNWYQIYDGEIIHHVKADKLLTGGNGLEFYQADQKIAHFLKYHSWLRLEEIPWEEKTQDLETCFREDIRKVLNTHNKDSELNTPDFLLADYLIKCLKDAKEKYLR